MLKTQQNIDKLNAEFWDELCGSSFAKYFGIKGNSQSELARFDREFFRYYPYLKNYTSLKLIKDKKVLEVGLGYGTLGGYLAEQTAEYHGLDIALGPVKMMNHRLSMLGKFQNAVQGSILQAPFADETFDVVVSIGCLHHTGDIQEALDEVYRILKPGGCCVFMVYNQYGLHSWMSDFIQTFKFCCTELGLMNAMKYLSEERRRYYDQNSKKEAAPETILSSKKELRSMLAKFCSYKITNENLGGRLNFLNVFTIRLPRKWLLSTLGRIMGSDLYVIAQK